MAGAGSFGVDYSFSRPGGSALQGAGVEFALRYLWPYTDDSKGINSAEWHDLTGHGIDVALLYEEDGYELCGGYGAGQSIAATVAGLLAGQDFPANHAVYVCCDFDASGADLSNVVAGVQGFASVHGWGSTGFYGGVDQVRAVQAAGACAYFFQTYAWSYSTVADAISVHQYDNGEDINGSVDYDTAYADNFGQNGLTAGGTPVPELARLNACTTLYLVTDQDPDRWILAGDSPGTTANWIETTNASLAASWAVAHGDAVLISQATYANFKDYYLMPVALRGELSFQEA